jgi:hypothetical protein
MKKTLNTEAISNELRGASAFFLPPENRDLSTTPPAPQPARSPKAASVQTPRRRDAQAPGHPDVQTPRPPNAQASRHLDTHFDLATKPEERQTLRLTEREFRRLGSLQAALSEQLGVTRVEKNDILRAGLHRVFEDFAERGVGSDLVNRLRKKYR